jgi:hypothetical protein
MAAFFTTPGSPEACLAMQMNRYERLAMAAMQQQGAGDAGETSEHLAVAALSSEGQPGDACCAGTDPPYTRV